jgi:hypothetical protein
MQCYAFSVIRGQKLVGRSHRLTSLNLDISATFFSLLDLSFFRSQKLSLTIRTYSSRAYLKKNRAGHPPYFGGERSRWIATVASCHTESEVVFTDDNPPNLCTARDQIGHKQKYGNGSIHQYPWIRRNRTSPITNKKHTYRRGTDREENSGHRRHLSNRARLRMRPSPPSSLALFLDSKANPSPRIVRALDGLDLGNESWDVTLPGILLRYLFLTQHSEVRTTFWWTSLSYEPPISML